MKKLIAIVCLLAMVFTFCACLDDTNSIKIINKTAFTIDNVYITALDVDSWGEPVSKTVIDPDRFIRIGTDSFMIAGTETYDVGTINHNGYNMDAYAVDLHVGDTVTLTSDTVTVTSLDGTTETYEVYGYNESDLEGLE